MSGIATADLIYWSTEKCKQNEKMAMLDIAFTNF